MRSKSSKKLFVNTFIILVISISSFLLRAPVIYAEIFRTMECEYTNAYKKWLQMTETERSKVVMPSKCKSNSSFINVGSTLGSISNTRFDLRELGYITDVKDQGASGSCWAFSANASIESNAMVVGMGTYDLSEAHLELSTQSVNGLLPFGRKFNAGGNAYVAAAYLLDRIGPVSENDVPFSLVLDNVKNDNLTAMDIKNKDTLFSVNDIVLNSNDQGECNNDTILDIKKYLITNGAMVAGIHWGTTKDAKIVENQRIDKFESGKYYYYDGRPYTSINGGIVTSLTSVTNHDVTIVGWDDSIDKNNFGIPATRDGAFIIKNSYGKVQTLSDGTNIPIGEDGYYYVSYDDINICTSLGGFHNIDTDLEDNNYVYDTLGINYGLNVNNSDLYLANVFEKKSQYSEELKKINFYSEVINQKIDVFYSDDGDLNNFKKIKSITTDHTGYINLDVDDIVISNDKFAIAIKYNNVGGGYPIRVYNKSAIPEIYNLDVPSNVSFFSLNGTNWGEFVYEDNYLIASIKSYTNTIDYGISVGSKKEDDNKLIFGLKYFGIDDLDNITYNIYHEEDEKFENSLNDDFEIIDDIINGKSISIENKDANSGTYQLVIQYKKITLNETFYIDAENNLTFENPNKVDDDNNKNDNPPSLIVDDNPKNNINVPTDVADNPKTSNYKIVISLAIMLLTLVGIVIYQRRKNIQI